MKKLFAPAGAFALAAALSNTPALADGISDIAAAAHAGDIAKMRALLDQDPSLVNASYRGGWTLLHMAAQRGNVELAELVLSRGANVYAKLKSESGGGSPLHVSAATGQKSIVALLLAKGVGANICDDNEWTPLHRAALKADREVAELLLAKGGDAYAWSNTNTTPIDQAIALGYSDFANYVREAGRTTLPIADACPPVDGQLEKRRCFLSVASRVHIDSGLRRPGRFTSSKTMALDTPNLVTETSATVKTGMKPRYALLGIGCLTDGSTGYVGLLSWPDGDWAIMRLKNELTQLAGEPKAVNNLAETNRLRIACMNSANGPTAVTFFVNDHKVGSATDRHGYSRFNGVALSADTFPGDVVFEHLKVRQPAD